MIAPGKIKLIMENVTLQVFEIISLPNKFLCVEKYVRQALEIMFQKH
jgi:hypothetical protein